jgi:hypothetical protein
MKSELIPLNGDPPIAVTRDLTLIGRREYCDVVVGHPSLSKRHCVLVRTDGLLVIRDLITTNGTKVNGQRVMWAALLPNDRLTLGRLKFRVYLGPDDVPSPSELAEAKRPLERLPVSVAPPVAAALPEARLVWDDEEGFEAPSNPNQPVVPPSARPGETPPDPPPSSPPRQVSIFENDDLEFLDP